MVIYIKLYAKFSEAINFAVKVTKMKKIQDGGHFSYIKW